MSVFLTEKRSRKYLLFQHTASIKLGAARVSLLKLSLQLAATELENQNYTVVGAEIRAVTFYPVLAEFTFSSCTLGDLIFSSFACST